MSLEETNVEEIRKIKPKYWVKGDLYVTTRAFAYAVDWEEIKELMISKGWTLSDTPKLEGDP